jgi:membrane protein required for colicin V production
VARIACPGCAEEVSDLATSCPQCGRGFTADPPVDALDAEASEEVRVHTDELDRMSWRAARGVRVDVLALLVGGIVTLIVAYLTSPVQGFHWTNDAPDFARMYRSSELRERASRPVSAAPPLPSAALPEPAAPIAPAPPQTSPAPEPAAPRAAGPLDAILVALVALALLRGAAIGALREATSLGVVVATVIAVRVWNQPFAHWLQSPTGASVRYDLAPFVAGALLTAVVLVAVALFAREMRQGLRPVGHGILDRVAGGALGLAEGLLVVGVLTVSLGALLGREHALVVTSHSLAWVEHIEQAFTPATVESRVAAPLPR